MTFDDYQQQALATNIKTNDIQTDRSILALGVAGEAGEVADKWKKILCYQDGTFTDTDIEGLAKELGDVMWYIAAFADSFGLQLDDIARGNLAKLADRAERNILKGEGDNR
jgi:NTP pyrophosphatase (non-canonical NTP hydrolase)